MYERTNGGGGAVGKLEGGVRKGGGGGGGNDAFGRTVSATTDIQLVNDPCPQ
jgi:hypothetical protein